LVGHSLLEIVSRAFYALHDTRTPVLVGVAAMTLNVVLSLILWRAFAAAGWMPHGALALANSLATTIECGVLLGLIRRRLDGLHGRRLRPGLIASTASAGALSLALAGWLLLTQGWPPLAVAAGGLIVGLGVYLGVAVVLGAPEPSALWTAASRRLGRQPGA
jgi:putative peptidoglycan lipid II flippase